MKKDVLKRLASMMLATVVAFSMIFVSAGEVNAADDDYYIALPDVLWVGDPVPFSLEVGNMNSDNFYKITSASTKSNAIKIEKETFDGQTQRYVLAKKVGTATIKVTFKTNSGKKHISKKITVKKYPKPVKSLKVAGKTISLTKNKFSYDKKYTGTAPKVKLTPRSGWTIQSVYGYHYDKNWNGKQVTIKKSKIKTGGKLRFPKKYKSMQISVYMSNKSGDSFTYTVNLNRP